MRISNLVRLCVAYVAAPTADKQNSVLCGTGFFVLRPVPGFPIQDIDGAGRKRISGGLLYFVTARHVVENVRGLGCEELWIRANDHNGGWGYVKGRIDAFTFHPDPTVDLAIAHTDDGLPSFDVTPWILDDTPESELLRRHNIGVGTPVSILGMFHRHSGTERNLPIVRTGNIAAMPEERVQTRMGPMHAMLVEARSIGGLSGSPVFANLGMSQVRLNPQLPETDFISGIHLLGVMHGHWDENVEGERVNVGIGIVTPLSKLLELLTLPSVITDERKTIERHYAHQLLHPDGNRPI